MSREPGRPVVTTIGVRSAMPAGALSDCTLDGRLDAQARDVAEDAVLVEREAEVVVDDLDDWACCLRW